MRRRRGSAMVEAALVTTSFIFLLVGIMDFGRLGFAYNSVTYAAHRAARFAATNGSGSGHAASASDIQSNVQSNIVALDTSSLTVNVTWTPDNHPGSKVQVVVSYSFKPLLIPISSSALTLKSTSSQIITQ
jgi:Flp pilus assembly protein TadG